VRLAAPLLLAALLLLAAPLGARATAEVKFSSPRAITLGLHDHSSEEKIRRSGEPLAKYLAAVLGAPVRLVICPDYQDLARRFISGELAFAVFPAYAYTRTARVVDLKLLANLRLNDADCYRGAVVVRRDAGIRSVADLKGKAYGFVSPDSASGYLYPLVLFSRLGIDPEAFFGKVVFAGSHDAVIRRIVAGELDGGSIFEDELRYFVEAGGDISNLKVIARTDPVPFDAFVAQANIPPDVAGKVTKALVDYRLAKGVDPRGHFVNWRPPDDGLYNPVRAAAKYLEEIREKRSRVLRFGVYPKVSPEKTLAGLAPVAAYLERKTGFKIVIKLSPNLLDVGQRLLVGDTDFAVISPFAYVQTVDRAKLRPWLLAQQVLHGSNLYHSVVLARRGRDTLEKLKGGRFAFVDPDSASGRLVPLHWLKRQGIDLKSHFGETFYAGGHRQAFDALLEGRADACACGDFIYESAKRDKRPGVEELVVLHRSEKLPHECIVARGDLPAPVTKALTDALFALNGSEPGNAEILKGMGYDRLAESLDSAYDPIRRLARDLLSKDRK